MIKRRGFVACLSAVAVASCARMEQRTKRYDESECPFCSVKPGVCSYCDGSRKCSYCNGTGKRKTTTKNFPEPNIESVTIEEDCPYCGATGKCRYCDGVGKCWACRGKGRIESWDFYAQHLEEKQAGTPPAQDSAKSGREE